METIFQSIFSSGTLSISGFLITLFCSLILGAAIAFAYSKEQTHSNGFLLTISLLPAVVAVIIMMVNGSLGASVAVAGAFSLVRFRSNPGTAQEICAVFLAMAVGLACGIGYPAFAALFTLIICIINLLYNKMGFLDNNGSGLKKSLHITIPEDLEYGEIFDDLFEKYTKESRLNQIKTTNLGSMNKLYYEVTLRKAGTEKAFIDELRCRNGNLEISLAVTGAMGEL